MSSRKAVRVFAAVLTAASLALLPGCDWFKGSGSESRLSPFLSNLGVSPSAVLCDQKFSVSFHYDDPQGDISGVRLSFEHNETSAQRSESPLWPESASRKSGTVSFPLTFSCGTKGGLWTITVRVEDDQGHTGNSLTGQIRLNAAG